MLIVILFLFLVVFLSFYFLYSPKVKKPDIDIIEISDSLEIDGVKRDFYATIPKKHKADMPLVFVFHGTMQNGKVVREAAGYEFDEIAENEGFVVVYPNAYKGSWNDARKVGDYPARRENINEAEFVRKMIQYFQLKYNIDPKKVFGVGFSNGGQLVHRLASEIPGEFKAFAAIMATRPTIDNFIGKETDGEVPMLLIAGTSDSVVPYHGGVIQLFFMKPRGTAMSAYESADFYAKRNGIYSAPIAKFLPHNTQSRDTAVIQVSYKGEGKKPVELYTAVGVGHVIPNKNKRFPRLMGKSTADLDAPKEIWKFFKQFI
ncbi:alpha/beta hydrolase family esterase [Clostridium intestinale]|jgi:polyhydroxybutyrate depolymerase|uniref:Prolyl oligopeptidase family serine peptidase n=1 Tax=Clostridium intestinale TaxID=36845 RepID=A0A7D6VXI0_9CLOT|nr:PHB depolymerase family esterase [Clostridium intestinale]QLY77865.1 prolyl oligopeptidase family serine peptidase [Clostridium intestinale]